MESIGYLITSKLVLQQNTINWVYREEPDDDQDSGWRIFSGSETQEYTDEPDNFVMCDVNTILEIDNSLESLLSHDFDVEFEKDPNSGQWSPLE